MSIAPRAYDLLPNGYNLAMDHLLAATARAEQRHFWFRGFRAFVVPLVRQALHDVAHPRILDCGCGTGANLELLSRFGDAYGFDLTARGLQYGRKAGRTRLARGSITAAPFGDASFDLVTTFDVLYALPEAAEATAVRELHRLVKPGGHVLLNVAAMEILRGDHSVLSHEQRRYSRARVEGLLTRVGLVPVRLTYTNASLFMPMLLARAFQRWRGLAAEHKATGDISVPVAPVNALLSGVLLAESLLVRRFDLPFGSSLLCLARRPPGDSDTVSSPRPPAPFNDAARHRAA
jgi:SAM-dependent methyltransferase